EEVLKFARRLAVLHRYADDFVSDTPSSVPGAVLRGKCVVRVLLRELVAVIERQSKRGHVRLQEDIGDNHLLLQFGTLSLMSRVLIRAEVIPGPAVKTTLLDLR